MVFWQKLRRLLPWVRRADDRDIDEELAALEAIAGPHALGNLTLAAEDARSVGRWIWLERLGQDLRYAIRSARHQKSFAALVILTMALGIGANTAIFTFTDAVLLRPLPVRDPSQLVVMKWRAKGYTLSSNGMSWSTSGSSRDDSGVLSSSFPYPALKVFQDSTDILSSAFLYNAVERLSFTANDLTDSVKGHYVTGHYFTGMGVAPAAGRLLQVADDHLPSAAVVVLSEQLAVRRFGEPRAALRQTVRINNKPFEVVGVTPAEFFGAEPGSVPDLYMPVQARRILDTSRSVDSIFLNDHFYWADVMARLQPGVDMARAQQVLGDRFHAYVESTAKTDAQRNDLPRLVLESGATGLDGLQRQYARPLYALMVMVGLVLLIACANVANLLLARAAARRKEIAIRLGIGAGRWRLVRQLLTESLLLSFIGGALGVAVAWWGSRELAALLAGGRAHFSMHAELNLTVLGVAVALSVLTGVLFGLVPALQATRLDMVSALNDARTTDHTTLSRRLRAGPALVVLQVALSVPLLVAAGLFGRTLSNLNAIDVGFSRDNVLLFTIRPAVLGYEGQALGRLYEDVRQQLAHLPGVVGATISSRAFPMGGGSSVQVTIDGAEPLAGAKPSAVLASVGADFFKTMGMPVAAGRDITAADSTTAPRVVVINRHLARLFGLENPVGHTLVFSGTRFEIVGLVDDAVAFSLTEKRFPVMYLSYLQGLERSPATAWSAPTQMTYEVRTSGHPMNLSGPVRDLVRQVDSRVAIHDLKTQATHIGQAITREIALARLGSIVAILALVMACVGLYGTVSFNVSRRTREIGIRMALGAQPGRIVRMAAGEVLLQVTIGLAAGLSVSLLGARYVKSLLYGITPNDPLTIAGAVAALLLCGLLSTLIPASRATRVDPMRAVRQD